MKQIWIFTLLVIASFTSHAQKFGNHDAINLRPVLESEAGTLANGKFYYDRDCSCFRFRQNGTWVVLGGAATVADGDKGDISVTGGFWTIDNSAVTYSKIQNMATSRIHGRVSAGSGIMEELTGAQVNTMLPVFTTSLNGLAPAPGGSPTGTKYLTDIGTYTTPTGTGSGTTETASNLLTKVGDDIRMGGTSTANTTLSLTHNYKITEGSYAFGVGTADFFYGGFNMGWGDQAARSGQYSNLRVAPEGVYISAKATTGGDVTLSFRNDNIILTDNRTTKFGMMTGGPGYVSSPRSYGDKEYIDAAVANAGTVKTIGTINGQTKSTNGAVITGTALYMQTAEATRPGLVSITAQTFAGEKTLSSTPILSTVPTVNNSTSTVLTRNNSTGRIETRNDIATNIASGTYTPTGTAIDNVDVLSVTSSQYIRVGNVVTVSGGVNIDGTTIGNSIVVHLTLPLASNLVNGSDLAGVIHAWNEQTGGSVSAEPFTDKAGIVIIATTTTNEVYYYQYTYRIL